MAKRLITLTEQLGKRRTKIDPGLINPSIKTAPVYADQRPHQTVYIETTMGRLKLAPDDSKDCFYWVVRDLSLLNRVLDQELRAVNLSEGEASLIVDVVNGTIFDPVSVRYLWEDVADGIELDGLDEKWDVDGASLVAKLRGLTYTQTVAIIEAAERFWNLPTRSDNLADDLRLVGLLRD